MNGYTFAATLSFWSSFFTVLLLLTAFFIFILVLRALYTGEYRKLPTAWHEPSGKRAIIGVVCLLLFLICLLLFGLSHDFVTRLIVSLTGIVFCVLALLFLVWGGLKRL